MEEINRKVFGIESMILIEQKNITITRIQQLEDAAKRYKREAYTLESLICKYLNEQYMKLIGNPVVIRFNWKTVEHIGVENEWRGYFMGFEQHSTGTAPQPRVKYYKKSNGNQFDSFKITRFHTAYNIISIEPDTEHNNQ